MEYITPIIPKGLKVIVFNGPPFVGKDEAVLGILEQYPKFIWARFKNTLYRETAKDLDLDLDFWIRVCNDVILKDMPFTRYAPMRYNNRRLSPREILIDKSENQIKVEYGDKGVAILTIKDLILKAKDNDVIVFSDGGFNIEIECLMEELNLSREDILTVSIKRHNFDFTNDSREWLVDPDHVLHNDGNDLAIFKGEVLSLVNNFLNHNGTK